MLKLFSTLKRQRIPVGNGVRFLTTEEQLQLGYVLTKPLDPKIETIWGKYRKTWFYSSHIDAHKNRLGWSGINGIHAQLRKEERIRIQTSPVPLALAHLNPQAIGADVEQEYEEELNPDDNESTVVNPLEQRNIIAAKATQLDDTRKEIFKQMQQSREELLSQQPDPYEFNKYPARWMMDYETFDDTTDGFASKSEYGTPGNWTI